MPSLQGYAIATGFFVALALAAGTAKGDHMNLDRMLRVSFGCDTKAQTVAMIEASTDAAASLILQPGGCYRFGAEGMPMQGLSYEGTFHDPMAQRDIEVYKVKTSWGEEFFTSVAAPKATTT